MNMTRGQSIRSSQYIFMYGVGSILEGPNGPRIIPQFRDWGRIFGQPNTENLLSNEPYVIRESIISALLNGGRIFRLPTNKDLQIPDEQVIFNTRQFPNWALCEKHKILYELTSSGMSRCPNCDHSQIAKDEAIRFVRACSQGHLDDVDWAGIVHRNNTTCKGRIFDWTEKGSTLYDLVITCRSCGQSTTLRDIYYGSWSCSGRFPESETRENCDERANVLMRNASNLRVPALEIALTIPPRTTPLHRILENFKLLIASDPSITKDNLLAKIRTAATHIPGISPITIAEIEKSSDQDIHQAITDVLQPIEQSLTSKIVREREFTALQQGSIHGAPPNPTSKPTDFEIDKYSVITSRLSPKITLKITPIKRLRVIIAQRGYRRLIRGNKAPQLIETFYTENQNRYYVGLEIYGEGIFIDLAPNQTLALDHFNETRQWLREFKTRNDFEFHPAFVWWHTLSHRLINALSIDSGYSSASIRERIYIKEDNNQVHGGILIYTSQRGGDGSLGGLIALIPKFERVISSALRNLNSCSNDPLCAEQKFRPDSLNGAACFACLFTSETSCEFGNRYLDRNLLRITI
jgi:hypothetical protein